VKAINAVGSLKNSGLPIGVAYLIPPLDNFSSVLRSWRSRSAGARAPGPRAQIISLEIFHCTMDESARGAAADPPPRVLAQLENADAATRKRGKLTWSSLIGSGKFVLFVDDLNLSTYVASECAVQMLVNADKSISCAEPDCTKPHFGASLKKRSADAAAKHLRLVHLPQLLISTRDGAAALAASIGGASKQRK
jgi:hypothetical protein